MNPNIENSGIPSKEQIERTLPSKERREKGPYVVIECWQKIPCNPCVKACPFGVIQPMEDINDLPVTDIDKCTGCGLCISLCPGLAIFVIDETYGEEDQALVMIPHEFVPIPKKGDLVQALDRQGNYICDAQVVRTTQNKSNTTVVHLLIPREFILDVRAIKP